MRKVSSKGYFQRKLTSARRLAKHTVRGKCLRMDANWLPRKRRRLLPCLWALCQVGGCFLALISTENRLCGQISAKTALCRVFARWCQCELYLSIDNNR